MRRNAWTGFKYVHPVSFIVISLNLLLSLVLCPLGFDTVRRANSVSPLCNHRAETQWNGSKSQRVERTRGIQARTQSFAYPWTILPALLSSHLPAWPTRGPFPFVNRHHCRCAKRRTSPRIPLCRKNDCTSNTGINSIDAARYTIFARVRAPNVCANLMILELWNDYVSITNTFYPRLDFHIAVICMVVWS